MKLSHRCIITRQRLKLSQATLANKILTQQSKIACFEDTEYNKLNRQNLDLLYGILLDIDYKDLSWGEMALLKLKENNLSISKLSRKLNIPSSQISLVLNNQELLKVSKQRIDMITRYIDNLGLFRITIKEHA